MPSRQNSRRLLRTADIGRLIAEGRQRTRLSQEQFSSRIGISRKTLSDLERGVADHVSLQTAMKALSLAGFLLEASPKRPPTLAQVMAQRAEHQARVDRRDVVIPADPEIAQTSAASTATTPPRRVPVRKRKQR